MERQPKHVTLRVLEIINPALYNQLKVTITPPTDLLTVDNMAESAKQVLDWLKLNQSIHYMLLDRNKTLQPGWLKRGVAKDKMETMILKLVECQEFLEKKVQLIISNAQINKDPKLSSFNMLTGFIGQQNEIKKRITYLYNIFLTLCVRINL